MAVRTHLLLRMAAGALALPLLAGCYEISSEVPAVTEGSRLTAAPLLAGRYCAADVFFDDEHAVDELTFADCFTVEAGPGTMRLVSDDAPPEEMIYEVADLTRGARLLQRRDADGVYLLSFAMMRDGGVAVLDEPALTPAMEEVASAGGVTLAPWPDDGAQSETREIDIVNGDSESVLGFLRETAGLMFDDALRDLDLGDALRTNAIYYVRVGTTVEDADMDVESAKTKVAALEQMIERAMALE